MISNTNRIRFSKFPPYRSVRLFQRGDKNSAGDLSPFASLSTALAATIGTGNIVGVATAVAAGGPGAVLWMWLTGVFGFATKYAEALLSVKFRVTNAQGRMSGGPMYVLERGLRSRPLAIAFAVLTAVAAFGIGNMVQANAISSLADESLGISPWISGGAMTVLTAVVILGGITAIARVCELLVPFMAIFYVLGCIALLGIGWETLGDSVGTILSSALSGQAAVGGFLGAGMREAMRFGIARGLFSNEAGLGSAPIVAAAAQTKNPVRQALVSATGTFWDTVVVCAMTGLVIVNSGEWETGARGAALTHAAFAHLPGFLGPLVLNVGLVTFVFSTILGWSYYGEKAVEYLVGVRGVLPYRLLWVAAVLVGSVAKLSVVWDFADIANALMAIPNLVSLLALNGLLVVETRKWLWEGRLDAAEQTEAA